jgi:hypothetical protein
MPAIIFAAVLAAAPPPPPPCPDQLAQEQAVYAGGATLHKLADLPPGLLYHAVLKEVGGCSLSEVRTTSGWVDFTTGPAHPPIQAATPPGR